MNPASFVSVGIDIGTTSTHLTISRLEMARISSATKTPKFAICSREILYESPIQFTPLTADGAIDGEAVGELIANHYASAGFSKDKIDTGVAIVTGETARMRNAAQIIAEISKAAGEFVVESAGPDLESVLAGRGCGAAKASKELGKVIASIDIGGGTCNVAIFSAGNLIDSSCIRLGGRIVQFDLDGKVTKISASGQLLRRQYGKTFDWLEIGSRPTQIKLEEFACKVAQVILHMIAQHSGSDEAADIASGHDYLELWVSQPLKNSICVDEYWFTGGVAALIENSAVDKFQFGDLGCHLADRLLAELKRCKLPFHVPPDPIRATVIGAGQFSVQISGSTVGLFEQLLPLRNVPLMRLNSSHAEKLKESYDAASKVQQFSERSGPVGFVLSDILDTSFKSLTELAKQLASLFRGVEEPLLLVVERDIAMALWQILRPMLDGRPLFVLDGVDAEDGDLIDVGKPIAQQSNSPVRTVPVVIKNLIFR